MPLFSKRVSEIPNIPTLPEREPEPEMEDELDLEPEFVPRPLMKKPMEEPLPVRTMPAKPTHFSPKPINNTFMNPPTPPVPPVNPVVGPKDADEDLEIPAFIRKKMGQ